MSKYIDANSLLHYSGDLQRYCGEGAEAGLKEIIKMCPAADVAPVIHAHWKVESRYIHDWKLDDKAILKSLKETTGLFKNGNLAEVEDICREIADAIEEFEWGME